MKLLTLNTHSLVEENYAHKLKEFIAAVAHELPDVIALQEINQRQDGATVSPSRLNGYIPCDPSVVIREGNYAFRVIEGLRAASVRYHWTWLPIKRGYGHYDEGVAVMSRAPIAKTDIFGISQTQDYNNWKTRRILGARIGDIWFYCAHLGWWDDPDEPFKAQWARIHTHVAGHSRVFLLGDFNSPAETRGEGYDLVIHDGWRDTYAIASRKDNGITVSGRIAGWTHRELPAAGARVDHVFCNFPCKVISSRVIFNGDNRPVVSDHFGVMVEIEEL
ncbi:MAG: exodeoxyribonuclease III [Ruminococcaceae bacterium]|nr:exodeoxyribonuclease III [Oscillospiraceae bacterium]